MLKLLLLLFGKLLETFGLFLLQLLVTLIGLIVVLQIFFILNAIKKYYFKRKTSLLFSQI